MKIGVESGLVDAKHYEKMGAAVWLFLWCVWRQTKRNGLVLGGMPLTYDEIATRSGFPARKLRYWLKTLVDHHYIEVTYLNFKMLRLRVVKQKKWTAEQGRLPLEPSTENSQSSASSHRRKTVVSGAVNSQSSDEKQSIQADFQYREQENHSSRASGGCQDQQTASLERSEPPPPKKHVPEVIPPVENRSAIVPVSGSDTLLAVAAKAASIDPELRRESWAAIGSPEPLGTISFQQTWMVAFSIGAHQNLPLEDRMEKAIIACRHRGVAVPQKFYVAKRIIEKRGLTLLPERQHESFDEARRRRSREAISRAAQAADTMVREVARDVSHPRSHDRAD